MKKFIFTFGIGTPLRNRYQPIIANDSDEARAKMFEIYGSKWAAEYTEEQWYDILSRTYKSCPVPTALDPIMCGEFD